MKKLLLILILLSIASYAEEVCDSINMNSIKKLYAKETKKLHLFTPLYSYDSTICELMPESEKIVVLTSYVGKMKSAHLVSIVIAIVDKNNEKILQSYFYKDIAISDAIAIKRLSIDTKTYSKLSKYKPFRIRIKKGVEVTHSHAILEDHIFLFESREKEIKVLLDDFDLGGSSMICENYSTCLGENVKFELKALCEMHDYCPIILKTYTESYYLLPITSDNEPIKKTKAFLSIRKLVFKNEEYQELKVDEKQNIALSKLTFNEVEKGAKNGKYYSRYELARLIYQPFYVEGEFKKVRQLNDIAYYLQKSGYNLEAVMLLEILIKEFPNRTVAYYNLADAYWELGRKKEAKKMYEVYVKQMEVKGKRKKIPKVVLERLK